MTFDHVKEHVLNNIQKNYNNTLDIYKYIEEGNDNPYRNKPVRKIEVVYKNKQEMKIDEFMTKLQQDGLDFDYSAELQRWRDRETALGENKSKAATFIFGYCSKVMQSRLKNIPNFNTRVKQDPVEMLHEINKKCMTRWITTMSLKP